MEPSMEKDLGKGELATAFVEQYLKFKAAKMKSKEAFLKIQQMGFTGTRRTLNRHVASVRRTGHALAVVKKDSSHPTLNNDQMSEVDTWVLSQNIKNIPIAYADVQRYIADTYDINICTRTAGNILHRLGYRQKTGQSKTAGFTKTTISEVKKLQDIVHETDSDTSDSEGEEEERVESKQRETTRKKKTTFEQANMEAAVSLPVKKKLKTTATPATARKKRIPHSEKQLKISLRKRK